MTIAPDLDSAIKAAQARGVGIAAMSLRMGVGALRALVADAEEGAACLRHGFPIAYRSIPIEHVEPPTASLESTRNNFHGWELTT